VWKSPIRRPVEELKVPEFLQTTIDKFIFKVATDRYYDQEGLWMLAEGNCVRIGLSDFLQQRSGDVAFVELKPVGTTLRVGDEFASIETIKVTIGLASPVSGKVVRVNPALETSPEAINLDPYGEGWLVVIETANWESERLRMLEPQAYFDVMKGLAEEEVSNP
jgi:glycine cleavage system H protein